MTTAQYRFEARNMADDTWHETTEDYLRERLRRYDPTDDIDRTIAAMKQGDEADDGDVVFRAVAIVPAADLRIVYTTAPVDYDGFGTTTLDPDAGLDNRGKVLRKVGIRPGAWDWQTTRYASGLHGIATEDEVARYPSLYRLKQVAK